MIPIFSDLSLWLWVWLCREKLKIFQNIWILKLRIIFTCLFCTSLKFLKLAQHKIRSIPRFTSSNQSGKWKRSQVTQADKNSSLALPALSFLFSDPMNTTVHFIYSLLVKLKSLQASRRLLLNIHQQILFSPHVQKEMGFPQCVYVLVKREVFLLIPLESYRHSFSIPNSHQS